MTLISIHNSEDCVGRCDARCYEAKGDLCECCCGGMNHKKGLQVAMEQTQEHAKRLLVAFQGEHSEMVMKIIPKQEQEGLCFEEGRHG